MFKKRIQENLAVKKDNQNLNKKIQEHKQDEINLLNNTVRELLNLQDINRLGIEEKEKDKHRNIIINELIKTYLDKINELSSTVESFR